MPALYWEKADNPEISILHWFLKEGPKGVGGHRAKWRLVGSAQLKLKVKVFKCVEGKSYSFYAVLTGTNASDD